MTNRVTAAFVALQSMVLLCASSAGQESFRGKQWYAELKVPAQAHATVQQASLDLTLLWREHGLLGPVTTAGIRVYRVDKEGKLGGPVPSRFVPDRGSGVHGHVTGRVFWEVAGVSPKDWRDGNVMRCFRLCSQSAGAAADRGPGNGLEPDMLALGDFEVLEVTAYRQQRWSLQPGVTIVRGTAHRGNAALRVLVLDTGEVSTSWSTAKIRVNPGEQYDVSMWWHARDAKGQYLFSAYLYYWDRDAKYLGRTGIGSACDEATFDWRQVRRQVEIPAGVAFLSTGAASRCVSGELLVDDVRIVPLPSEIRTIHCATAR